MATQIQKFGVSTWDEQVGPRQKQDQNQKREDWMRLLEGSNTVRIVTEPYQYLSHKYKEDGDPGYGDKIRCSAPLHKFCPVCALGGPSGKAKRRWLVGVIDRASNTYKVLDFSVAVYTALKKFKNNKKYGLPTNYDIDINVDSQAGATGFYTVIPSPPEALTEADIKIAQTANLDYLLKMSTPPTPEWALTKLNKTREKLHKAPLVMDELKALYAAAEAASAAANGGPAPSSNGASHVQVVDMADDNDLTFPPADAD